MGAFDDLIPKGTATASPRTASAVQGGAFSDLIPAAPPAEVGWDELQLLERARGGGAQMVGGIMQALGDVTGYDPLSKTGAGIAESGRIYVEDADRALQGREPGFWQRGAQIAAQSSVPMAISMLSGGLAPAAGAVIAPTLAGVQAGGTKYGEQRAEGLDPRTAGRAALGEAVIEGATEYLPSKYIFNPETGSLITRILKGLGADVAGEQVASLGQGTLDVLHGQADPRRPGQDMTLDTYVDEQVGPQAVDTLAASLVMAPVGAGATALNTQPRQQPQPDAATRLELQEALRTLAPAYDQQQSTIERAQAAQTPYGPEAALYERAGNRPPPGMRVNEDVEQVEAAPAPPASPMTAALEELLAAIDRQPPAGNIDVTREAPARVEEIVGAPPPEDIPDANIDVEELPVDESLEMDAERVAQESRTARMPKGLDDPRILRDWHRGKLRLMAEELTPGGGISTLIDERGKVTGRTKSQNPAWFQGIAAGEKISVKALRETVDKALAGKPLGARQARAIEGMLDYITERRTEDADFMRQQRDEARQFRREAAEYVGIDDQWIDQAGQMLPEEEYVPDWDGATRALHELSEEAAAVDPDAVEAILDSNRSDADVAAALWEIIGERAQQASPQETQGEPGQGPQAEAPAEADAPGAQDGAVTRLSRPIEVGRAEKVESAKQYFGVTQDPREAGYIMPDGAMLDMSGRHYSDDHPSLRGHRNVDHRELFGENMSGETMSFMEEADVEGGEAMAYFMRETGAIRVDARAGVADIMGSPTPQQMQALAAALDGVDTAYVSVVDPANGRIIEDAEIDEPSLRKLQAFYRRNEGKSADDRAPRFSRKPETRKANRRGPDTNKLQSAFDDLTSRYSGAAPVRVVATSQDLPAGVRKKMRAEGVDSIEGVWHRGTVWMVSDSLPTPERAARVYFHEVVGHNGLRGLFAMDTEQGRQAFDALLDDVLKAYRAGKWDKWFKGGQRDYLDLHEEQFASEREAAEEFLARLAESGAPDPSGFMTRLRAMVARLLRSLPGIGQYVRGITRAEIDTILANARRYVETGQAASTGTRFSRDVTDTPEFKRWFGDSKVVDDNGEPLVVYHGTNAEFDTFETGGNGAFFAEDPKKASTFAQIRTGGSPRVAPVFLRIDNPWHQIDYGLDVPYSEQEDQSNRALREKGYDGVRRSDGVWIAFRPEQIKSATGNRGTFDPNDPDIRMSRSMDTEQEAKESLIESYRDRAKKAVDTIDAVLSPLGSVRLGRDEQGRFTGISVTQLPARHEYMRLRNLALGRVGAADEVAGTLSRAFIKADADTKQQVYEYLTTADAKPLSIKDKEARQFAVMAKKKISEVSDSLVEAGLLGEETREANRDAYLPRMYLRHLLDEGDYRALGAGRKPSDMGYLKKRKDIPEEVRRVILGEIKDPGFLAAAAVARPGRDLALLKWLEQISANGDWALTEGLVDWKGRTVTPSWLKAEAVALRRQAPHYDNQEDALAARKMAREMDEAADEVLGDISGELLRDYRQIPDTPQFGRLRGMWVRQEIHEDIVGIRDMIPADPSWAEKLLGYGGIGTRATQLWKMSKVALNPPGQIRNATSNTIMLNLSGIPFRQIPVYLKRAVGELKTNGKYAQIAKKYGLSEATFGAQELYRAKTIVLEMEKAQGGLGILGAIKLGAGKVGNFAGDTYQAFETLGKVAKVMHAMEKQGMNEADAAAEAQKWLFDYSFVGRNVRYLRNAPVGMPFLTYQYKVLPRLIEVAALHPQRLLPYAALFYGMQYGMAAALDVDWEDLEKLKKALPEWLRERGHAMMMPFKDANGRWQFLDLGYFMPWSMYTEAGGQAARGEVTDALKTVGSFGGPLPDIITALKTGTDSFTGRQIANEADPPSKQALDILSWMWSMAGPPFLTETGGFGKLYQNATGQTDYQGEQRSTTAQALLRFVGLNVYGIDPVESRNSNIRRMMLDIEDVGRRLKSRLRQESDPERKARLVKDYREEIDRRTEKLNEYQEASEVHPNLR